MSEVITRSHYLPEQDITVIERVQDCNAIVQSVKDLRHEGSTSTADMKHAARFPAVIVEQYMNQHGITFQEFLKNPVHVKTMMNDSALAAFRVWEGAV